MTTVLLVGGDPQILDALRSALTARGYHVSTASEGVAALRIASRVTPQVVVLELGLPDIDGTEVIAGLRGWTDVPIIVLSGRADPVDLVRALDIGADDYLTKPFGMEELLARMRAVLRRAVATPSDQRPTVIDTGSFTVHLAAGTVWRDGAEVHLTPTEWRILDMLVRHEGCLVTRQQLLQEIWGSDHLTDTQYLRVYLSQLRHKLEPEPARPRHLITEPGVGYRFQTQRADVRPAYSPPGTGRGLSTQPA